MKKAGFLFILYLGLIFTGTAQESGNYKYIRVPEKYDSFKEENKYQLNALTAFLFEKQGCTVLYKFPVPTGVDPCEVLQADVEDNSGIFRSRVKVVLRDCNQQIVFSSEEGVSREKDYKISYHAALRDAFQSLEDVQIASSNPDENFDIAEEQSPAVMSERREEPAKSKDGEMVQKDESLPAESTGTTYFLNRNSRYELKKSTSGYDLFKEGQDQKFATLTRSGGGKNFIYTSKNVQGNSYFDESGNLVVEYIDANTGQLVPVTYQLLN